MEYEPNIQGIAHYSATSTDGYTEIYSHDSMFPVNLNAICLGEPGDTS